MGVRATKGGADPHPARAASAFSAYPLTALAARPAQLANRRSSWRRCPTCAVFSSLRVFLAGVGRQGATLRRACGCACTRVGLGAFWCVRVDLASLLIPMGFFARVATEAVCSTA